MGFLHTCLLVLRQYYAWLRTVNVSSFAAGARFWNYRIKSINLIPVQIVYQPVEKLSGERKTRQYLAIKRSLHVVNEHFEPDFNAVLFQLRVFQHLANPRSDCLL